MMEVVVALFDSASSAEAAIDDLEIARIPSAQVRQFGNRPDSERGIIELRHASLVPGDRIVAVTVEEHHARAVMEILDMQAPARMTEAPLKPARGN